MGYHTSFNGQFELDRPLSKEHSEFLQQFAETRRMKRNAEKTAQRPDPFRIAAGLPVGPDGGYFVGEEGFAGQDNGPDVVDHNRPPSGQPGLWCQWVPNRDNTAIRWDGGEKFYSYVEWLEYLIEHFLKPWGYTLNGEVEWEGEDQGDVGKIVVENNVVRTKQARLVWDES